MVKRPPTQKFQFTFSSLELSRGFFNGEERLRAMDEGCDFVAYLVAYFAKYAHAIFF